MLAAELKRSATISFAALVRSSTSTERSESDLDGEEKVSHAKSFLSEAISLSYLSPLKRSEIEAEKKKKKKKKTIRSTESWDVGKKQKGPKLIQLPPLETRPNSNGKSSAGVRSRGEISGVAIEKRRTMEDARYRNRLSEINIVPSVERMWNGLKADAMKMLKPAIIHSYRVTKTASPSARECLDIYTRPTTIDKFTGKPVPLGEMLSKARKTCRRSASIFNSAIGNLAKQTQMRAEVMMMRKDPYNYLDSNARQQDWFFNSVLDLCSDKDTHLETSRSTYNKPERLKTRRLEGGTSLLVKKKLPSYLTQDGVLVSGSLEEVGGELMYCVPSQRSMFGGEEAIQKEYSSDTNSVFLTNIVCPDSSRSTMDYDDVMKIPSGVLKSTGWQPLTTDALLEHTRVTEVPVHGTGYLAHGKYRMWRPAECTL